MKQAEVLMLEILPCLHWHPKLLLFLGLGNMLMNQASNHHETGG